MAPVNFTFSTDSERALFWMALGQDLDRPEIPTREELERFVSKAEITSPKSPIILALLERVRAHLLVPEGPVGAPGMGPPIAHATSPLVAGGADLGEQISVTWFEKLTEKDPGVFYFILPGGKPPIKCVAFHSLDGAIGFVTRLDSIRDHFDFSKDVVNDLIFFTPADNRSGGNIEKQIRQALSIPARRVKVKYRPFAKELRDYTNQALAERGGGRRDGARVEIRRLKIAISMGGQDAVDWSIFDSTPLRAELPFQFTSEWFDLLGENDPGVFFSGSQKFIYLDRPRRSGGIFLLTKNSAGVLCTSFLNPLGQYSALTEPAVAAIRASQKKGASRQLGADPAQRFTGKDAEGNDQIQFEIAGTPLDAYLKPVVPTELNLGDGTVRIESDRFVFQRADEEPVYYQTPRDYPPLTPLWFEALAPEDPGVVTINREKIWVLEIEGANDLVLIGLANDEKTMALTLLGEDDAPIIKKIRLALKQVTNRQVYLPQPLLDRWRDEQGREWGRRGFLFNDDGIFDMEGTPYQIKQTEEQITIGPVGSKKNQLHLHILGKPEKTPVVPEPTPPITPSPLLFSEEWFASLPETHPSVLFIDEEEIVYKFVFLNEIDDYGFGILALRDDKKVSFTFGNIGAHAGILSVIKWAQSQEKPRILVDASYLLDALKKMDWWPVEEMRQAGGHNSTFGAQKIPVFFKINDDRIVVKYSPPNRTGESRNFTLSDQPFPELEGETPPIYTQKWFDSLEDSHPAVFYLRRPDNTKAKAVLLTSVRKQGGVFGIMTFDGGFLHFASLKNKKYAPIYSEIRDTLKRPPGQKVFTIDNAWQDYLIRYQLQKDGSFVPADPRVSKAEKVEIRSLGRTLFLIAYGEEGVGNQSPFRVYQPAASLNQHPTAPTALAIDKPQPFLDAGARQTLQALLEGSRPIMITDPRAEQARELQATIKKINELRPSFRSIPLEITSSTKLGRIIQAATEPLPITLKFTQPGIDDFRTFRRQKVVPASASVEIRWGLDGSAIEYSIKGGSGHFTLEPKSPGPRGRLAMIYQEGKGVHLALGETSELHQWLDREISGPKLTVESDGLDEAPKLVFKVTGDAEGALIRAIQDILMPLTTEGVAFIQDPVVDGAWRGEIVYQLAQTSLILENLKAISHAYLDSLQKERKPSWINAVPEQGVGTEISGVPDSGSPLPEVTLGEDDTPTDDVTHSTTQVFIDLNHLIDTGLPGVEITFGTLESKTTGDKIFFVEEIKIRGEALKDIRFKFPIELKDEIEIPVIRKTKEHPGWERFTLRIRSDFTAQAEAYEFISHESRISETTIQPSIPVDGRHIDDPVLLDMTILNDPATQSPWLVETALRYDDRLMALLGDSPIIPKLKLKLPLELKNGSTLVFDIPLVGDVVYTLQQMPASGGWGAMREPFDFLLDIKTDHLGQASLFGSNGQKDQTFGLERISKRRGAHYFATEDRYILRQSDIPRFRAWLNLLGHPMDFDPTQHTDIEIIVITERGAAGKMTHRVEKILPFARNPDGTLPVRALQLDGVEYDLLTAALSGIEPHPAASGEAVQVLKPPQTPFFSTDHLKIAAGSVFLPTKETLDFIKKAFFERREGMEVFREGEKIEQRLEFANDEGLVISIPVTWTNRHRNPFRLDVDGHFKSDERGETVTDGRGVAVVGSGRRIEYYIRGHKRATRKPVDYSFRAHDQGGFWTFYEMTAIDEQKVKAFNLSVVINRHSPVLMSLVNTLNEAGVEDNAVTLRQNAREELDRHLARYFKQDLSELPPIYLPDRQLTYKEGKPIALAFVSDPETTPIRKAELSGFRLERGSRRLDFDPILTLEIEGEPAINLRHTAQSGADAVLLVEILPDGSSGRKFIWNISLGVVVEQKKGDAGPIDRAQLVLLIQKSGFPLTSFSTDTDDVGTGKKHSVQMRGGTIVGTDAAIPVIDESASGFSVPHDTNIDPVVEPAEVDKLLDLFSLHDEVFIPAEETVFAQTLIGRDEEVMTFITQSGIILQIPMKAEVESPYRYLANEVADSVYGIRGSRLLIPDPQKNGHYFELTAKAVHEKTHSGRNRESIELQILGNRKVNFRLNQVSSSETFSKKTVFGFHCVQVGKDPVVTHANARSELKAWIDYLNMNRAPDMASVGEGELSAGAPTIKLNDGRQLELKVVKVDEHHYRLTEIIADEGEGDRAPKAILNYWDESGDLKHFEVYRAADDSALYYLFDPETKKYSYLVLSADGNLWIWNRRSHIREFLSPPQSVNFPMVGIEGKVYTSGASSVATRVQKSDPADDIKQFEITAIMGRWDGATPKSFTADAGGKIARVRLLVTVAEDGTLSVAPGKIRDVEREGGARFPWGEAFRVQLVEDMVGGHIRIVFSQGSHYGWMAFDSREELVGAAENFRVARAHYHESKQFADRKLHPEDRGFLTKRAGVSVIDIPSPLVGEGEGEGGKWLEAFKSTEARASDLPILLGAMEYLGLVTRDEGRGDRPVALIYDESLLVSLAAFATAQNPGVQRTEIVKPPVRRRSGVKLVGGTTVQQPVRLVGSVEAADEEIEAERGDPKKTGKRAAKGVRTTTTVGRPVTTPPPPVTTILKR